MGTTYNVIVPVDQGYSPDAGVVERIRQTLGEGFELACRLGFTPDATISRQVGVQVIVGQHTFFLMSNEQVLFSNFAVVVKEALRQDGDSDSYTADAPEEALLMLSEVVGAPPKQVNSDGLVELDGDESNLGPPE